MDKIKAISLLNSHTDNHMSLLSAVLQLNSNYNHTKNHCGIYNALPLLNCMILINIQTLQIQLSANHDTRHTLRKKCPNTEFFLVRIASYLD